MHATLERLCQEHRDVAALVSREKEPSLAGSLDDNFRKSLVLSAASLFEFRIVEALLKYAHDKSSGNSCINSLIRNKAIKRQYHTYFDWDNRKAGTFFTLLGETIGGKLREASRDGPLTEKVSAFLELGFLRNCLVHQNFANFICPKNVEEIQVLCSLAEEFVLLIETELS